MTFSHKKFCNWSEDADIMIITCFVQLTTHLIRWWYTVQRAWGNLKHWHSLVNRWNKKFRVTDLRALTLQIVPWEVKLAVLNNLHLLEIYPLSRPLIENSMQGLRFGITHVYFHRSWTESCSCTCKFKWNGRNVNNFFCYSRKRA